jgi:hypothetical protein
MFGVGQEEKNPCSWRLGQGFIAPFLTCLSKRLDVVIRRLNQGGFSLFLAKHAISRQIASYIY